MITQKARKQTMGLDTLAEYNARGDSEHHSKRGKWLGETQKKVGRR